MIDYWLVFQIYSEREQVQQYIYKQCGYEGGTGQTGQGLLTTNWEVGRDDLTISITCSNISNIPYNLIFTTNLMISRFLLRLFHGTLFSSLANEYVGDITIPTQVIKYNQFFPRRISQSDCSINIKLNYYCI